VRPTLAIGFAAALLVSIGGCRQDMHDQPKYKPLVASSFFRDGRSARPIVEDTVARGHLEDDVELFTGKTAGGKLVDQRLDRRLRLREQPGAAGQPGIAVAPQRDLVGHGGALDLGNGAEVHEGRLSGIKRGGAPAVVRRSAGRPKPT